MERTREQIQKDWKEYLSYLDSMKLAHPGIKRKSFKEIYGYEINIKPLQPGHPDLKEMLKKAFCAGWDCALMHHGTEGDNGYYDFEEFYEREINNG